MSPIGSKQGHQRVYVSPSRRATPGPGVGDGAWYWTVTEENCFGEVTTTEYRTASNGRGLWVCGAYTAGDKQIAGTCQFSLRCSPSTRRARVLMTSDLVARLVDDRRSMYDPISPAQAYAELRAPGRDSVMGRH